MKFLKRDRYTKSVGGAVALRRYVALALVIAPCGALSAVGCAANTTDEQLSETASPILQRSINPAAQMIITVNSSGDGLRGSSRALISIIHPNGLQSSELEFSSGQAGDTTRVYTLPIANWDGYDPCATAVKIRLKQGSCFGCTSDKWSIISFKVDFAESGASVPSEIMPVAFGARFDLNSTVTIPSAGKARIGDVCYNNSDVVVCDHTLMWGSQAEARSVDQVCDPKLNCSAFKNDSGACGFPNSTCAQQGAYWNGICECHCVPWDPDCNDQRNPVVGCGSSPVCINAHTSGDNWAPMCL